MAYIKPQITTLGDAARIIQMLCKCGNEIEAVSLPRNLDPAYDLDE